MRCHSGAEFYSESEKNTIDEKYRYTFAFILKSLKNRFLSPFNSATEWSEQKKICTKIFSVKNCPRTKNFRFMRPFNRVPIFCAFALIILYYLYIYCIIFTYPLFDLFLYFMLSIISGICSNELKMYTEFFIQCL